VKVIEQIPLSMKAGSGGYDLSKEDHDNYGHNPEDDEKKYGNRSLAKYGASSETANKVLYGNDHRDDIYYGHDELGDKYKYGHKDKVDEDDE
jgi:hypothetical protein